MKCVLITGATGFVGRPCIRALAAAGYEVHAVSSKSVGQATSGVIWHHADLFEPAQVEVLLRTVQPSYLLHLAWGVTPGEFWTSLENFRWVQASLELLQAFARNGGQRAIMVGTCVEYDGQYGLCNEYETPLNPNSVYGVCKSVTQQMLAAFGQQTRLSTAWGRLFYLYGPHEQPARLVSSTVCHLLRGEPIGCTHSEQIRDFLYVDDAADALVALLDSTVTGAVNIGSGIPISLKELVLIVGKQLNAEHLITFGAIPARPDEPPKVLADITRLVGEIGWSPHYTVDQGIALTIDWWRNQLA